MKDSRNRHRGPRRKAALVPPARSSAENEPLWQGVTFVDWNPFRDPPHPPMDRGAHGWAILEAIKRREAEIAAENERRAAEEARGPGVRI